VIRLDGFPRSESRLPVLDVVIPVYNEEGSIPLLLERLDALVAQTAEARIHVILVDDHSTDASPALLKEACARREHCSYLRLARNSGSHVAILAGLEHSRGDCAVFLAADLQDPPELIREMLAAWRRGARVVWAVRQDREGIPWSEKLFSSLFYALVNRFTQVRLPSRGSDFALLDRMVVNALLRSVGANPSLGGEIARLGFSQAEVPYVKQARRFGRSKWTLGRKLQAFADAFVSFSYQPVRLMSYLGLLVSLLGFLSALAIIVMRLAHVTELEGWASLMVVVLVLGGFQMTMLGVLGEYLWRTLEAARHRPLYILEDWHGVDGLEDPSLRRGQVVEAPGPPAGAR